MQQVCNCMNKDLICRLGDIQHGMAREYGVDFSHMKPWFGKDVAINEVIGSFEHLYIVFVAFL
jgi:hypothetical protein